ncbi:MAG: mechanosensitive ion channel domain-containing protein [Candidatus Babeliales bacterium]
MNRKNVFLLGLMIGMCGALTYGAGPLVDPTRFIMTQWNEREEQLTQLKQEYQTVREETQENLRIIQERLDQATALVNQTKTDLATVHGTEKEYLTRFLARANDLYQTLYTMRMTYEEQPSILKQHVELLESFKKDTVLKGLVREPRPFYSFSDVQSDFKRVFDEEDSLEQLKTQKSDTLADFENRKKKVAIATKTYQERKKEMEEFTRTAHRSYQAADQTYKHKRELLDIDEQIARYEQQLAELRITVINRKIMFLNARIIIENQKLEIFKNNLERARVGLRINETEVGEARNKLEHDRQKLSATRVPLFEEIKNLSAKREQLKREIEQLTIRYKVVQSKKEEFGLWVIENRSLDGYSSLCEIGTKTAQLQLLEKRIEYVQAQKDLQDEQIEHEQVKFLVVQTWYQLLQHKTVDTETLQQVSKEFSDRQVKVTQDLAASQDKKQAIANFLNFQSKEVANLHVVSQEIKDEKDGMFKQYPLRYQVCMQNVADAEKVMSEQAEVAGKLLEANNTITNIRQNTLREIKFMINELHGKSRWQRSHYAISWHGIRNIIPDIIYFCSDVYDLGRSYIHEFSIKGQIANIAHAFVPMRRALSVIISIFLLIMGYLFLRTRLSAFEQYLMRGLPNQPMLNFFIHASICALRFVRIHLNGLYCWGFIFWIMYWQHYFAIDLFVRVIFYLVSIVYLTYITHLFIEHILHYNRTHNFPFFSPPLERRFYIVISLFAYTSIIILLFREAYAYATIHKSELPNILMAIYSIILRALVIFSIGKEEILALVSRRGFIWHWVEYIIENYYYLLLMAVIMLMILSDPYIGGYGNLISYLVWGIVCSLIVARALYELHVYLKKYSEKIFFIVEDDELKRERFGYARTWYGIAVIFFFILFASLGVIIAVKIWGLPIAADDFWAAFDFHLFSTHVEKGETVWFTPRKFLLLLSFIGFGLVSSVLFNKFVLQRIFQVLPVELGIQNTILSIARYLIVMISIYVGFQWAGLGTLLLGIGIVIGSISYISKEPVGDFISYFIILVQRPIQIGDYIALTEEIQGVVRKITPRSIILRRKDSFSIIVPNSMVLSHAVSNWHYARNFIAFDDITFVIPYAADPMFVKKIVQRVLEENIDVLKSPKYIVRLEDLGEYGFVFLVRGFISNINILRRWDIASDIRFAITKALREENIKIAVPTRVIVKE